MPKLHLVGVTADLKGLVFSQRARAKTGDLVVEVTDDLVQAIDEVRRLDARPRHPALKSHALPTRHDASSNGGSSLGLREIQHRLRTGETAAEVAARAGVTSDWVERFAAPVRAEQGRIVQLAWRLTASKARLGPSSAPLGLSVVTNVLDRGVTLSREEMDAAWQAFQVVDGVWTIRFEYASRGRPQVAEWELTEDPPVVRSSNKLASDLGHLEGEPAALAVALLAATPAKSGRRQAGQAASRVEEPPTTLPVVEVLPDREEPPPMPPPSQGAREASLPIAVPATPTPARVTKASGQAPVGQSTTGSTTTSALEEQPLPGPAIPRDDAPANDAEVPRAAESPATRALPVVRAAPVVKAEAVRSSTRVAGRRVSEGPTGRGAKATDRRSDPPKDGDPPERRSRRRDRAAERAPAKRLQRLPEGWLRERAEPQADAPGRRATRDGARSSRGRALEAGAAGSSAARSSVRKGATTRQPEPKVADRAASPGRRARQADGGPPARGASRSSRAAEAPIGSWSPPVQGARKARRR